MQAGPKMVWKIIILAAISGSNSRFFWQLVHHDIVVGAATHHRRGWCKGIIVAFAQSNNPQKVLSHDSRGRDPCALHCSAGCSEAVQ